MNLVPGQTSHVLVVDGERITYATSGDPSALPLVFVHGWMGAIADWRLLLPPLSERYYCVAVSLLGHGDSDKPRDGDYSIDAQARRVLAIVDAVGLETFALCGHSMGGMIALTIASRLAPERVTRVANLAGVIQHRSLFLKGVLWLAQRATFLVDIGFVIARWAAKFRWGQWLLTFALFFSWRRPVGYADKNLWFSLLPGVETPFWRELEAVMATNLLPYLPNITCPVFTLFGKQDMIVPPRQGQLVDARVAEHTLRYIGLCGHYLMLEKPQVCLEALLTFLESSG
jgi:pimeloyl-ACP methyl ester carboxylesterase